MELSRRVFLRYASGTAAAVGLAGLNLAQLEELFAATGSPPIIWLSGQACTGCSVSLLNAVNPTIDQLLTNTINLVYHPNLMSGAGDLAVAAARSTAQAGNYILVVEGAIPTGGGGKYCYVWDEGGRAVTMTEAVTSLAAGATKIVAVGSCSSFGGIPKVNTTTGAQGVATYLGKPVVNIPGCPAHPDWIIGSLSALLTGAALPLDSQGRPTMYFTSRTIHDRCPREEGAKATRFGVAGACLEDLGCKGPSTHADCDSRRWNNGQNYCIGNDSLCIGCTESTYPAFPLHKEGTMVQPTPVITVTSPNGGENWALGTSQPISWTSTGVSGNVNILLSRDGGSTYAALISNIANTGTYIWAVSGATSTQSRVRVVSVNSSIMDASNANFTISSTTPPPTSVITVTGPNGGENWAIGSNQNIVWTSSNVTGNVNINLSRDGGITYSTLAANVPNSGTYNWTVSGAVSAQARIQVVSLSTPTVNDSSNSNFTLSTATPPPTSSSIVVSSPGSGSHWALGSYQTVRWTSSNPTGDVRIQLSLDGGTNWQTVTTTHNDGSYTWRVSGNTTQRAKIRVARSTNASISGTSANFSITSQNSGGYHD